MSFRFRDSEERLMSFRFGDSEKIKVTKKVEIQQEWLDIVRVLRLR